MKQTSKKRLASVFLSICLAAVQIPITVCAHSSGPGDSAPSAPTVFTTPVTAVQPHPVTLVSTTISGQPDKNGTVTVTISEQSLAAAIRAAREQAGLNDISVTINIQLSRTANSLTVILTKAALDQLVETNLYSFRVTSSLISYSLYPDILKDIQESAHGQLTIVAARQDVTKLSKEAQEAFGGHPAFHFTLESGGKPLTDFSQGDDRVWIPYTPQTGESCENLMAVRIDEKGKVQWPPTYAYDGSTLSLMLPLSSFPVFGVGYKTEPASTNPIPLIHGD